MPTVQMPHHVTRLSDVSYEGPGYCVGFMPGMISLYGDVGTQMFEYNGKLDLENVVDYFSSMDVIRAAARLHTEGLVDKELFRKSVQEKYNALQILQVQYDYLMKFIADCDCPPSRIKSKLEVAGYGYLLPKLEYRVDTPEFVSTTWAFLMFISEMRRDLEVLKGPVVKAPEYQVLPMKSRFESPGVAFLDLEIGQKKERSET